MNSPHGGKEWDAIWRGAGRIETMGELELREKLRCALKLIEAHAATYKKMRAAREYLATAEDAWRKACNEEPPQWLTKTRAILK